MSIVGNFGIDPPGKAGAIGAAGGAIEPTLTGGAGGAGGTTVIPLSGSFTSSTSAMRS
ncbi:hypothetical protein D3C84_1073310 [compost metagenome]